VIQELADSDNERDLAILAKSIGSLYFAPILGRVIRARVPDLLDGAPSTLKDLQKKRAFSGSSLSREPWFKSMPGSQSLSLTVLVPVG
jgi:hypothetical protein